MAVVACATLVSSPALAANITLELKDGGLKITGELLSFDGTTYVMNTEALGKIRVNKKRFNCVGADCPDTETATSSPGSDPENKIVRIAGSGMIGAQLVPTLIRDYAVSIDAEFRMISQDKDHALMDLVGKDGKKLLSFDLKREGSSTAFPALANSEADIGTSDRPINDEEIGALANAGLPDMNRPEHESVVGLDGILLLVSPRNVADSLSVEDISRIFSGEIADWSELGLPAAKINIYAPDEKSGTFHIFRSLVLRPFKRELSSNAKRFQSNAELARAVAGDRGGIGFASFAEIGLAKPIAIRDTCGLTSRPSEFTVKTSEYPLSRNLYFYMRSQTHKNANALLDFAKSPAAGTALREVGFIDDEISMAPFNTFRDRVVNSLNGSPEDFDLTLMRDLIKTFENGMRVSATMRFETASSQLDSESLRLLPDVVSYISRQDLKSRKILLAGYSDTSGLFESNKELALKRAQAVRDALVLEGNGEIKPTDIEVRAYGELFPVACNDTQKGREYNRRVEIWFVPELSSSLSVLTKPL
jgi:phosphate transport system substrate-binding protein